MTDLKELTLGFAFTGSFCTLAAAIDVLEGLAGSGARMIPIISPIVAATDTRFGRAKDFIDRIESICGRPVIRTIDQAEPVGPKKLLDALIVAPCTGNTMAKLALGVTDTSVTMACKAQLRNARPVLLAIATNDALSANAKNLGMLLNVRNVFFVPFAQDDANKKPCSMMSDYGLIPQALLSALDGKQMQPLLLPFVASQS